MVASKIQTVQVAVLLTEENSADWYPVKGTSASPLPEDLPHLMNTGCYAELSSLVRKRIKKEARKAKRELSYTIHVGIEHEDPTAPVETPGAYLVAEIRFK